MQKIIKYKKVLVIALLATVLASPFAIRAYAQTDSPSEDPPVTEEQQQEEKVPEEEQEQTPPEEQPEAPVEEDEAPVTEEEEVPVVTEVTINEAIVIAQTEHQGSEVVLAMVKLKKLNDEKVYKVVFADGWRIYVRASDGEIVRIKDAANKKHDCSKRGQQAVASWRQNFQKKWGYQPTIRANKPKHYQQWPDYANQYNHSWDKPHQQKPQQPAPQPDPVEPEGPEPETED